MRPLLLVGSFGVMLLATILCVAMWNAQQTTMISYGRQNEVVINSDGTVFQGSQFIGRFHENATGTETLQLPLLDPQSSLATQTNSLGITINKNNAAATLSVSVVSLSGVQLITTAWQHDSYLHVTLYGVSPSLFPTLILTAPKGFFQLSPTSRLLDWISGLPLGIWFAVIALLVLVVGLYLLWRSRPVTLEASEERTVPPAGLHPLELAILHHYVIQPSDIMALLYFLAETGYLEIVDRGDDEMVFLRKSSTQIINPYEYNFLLFLLPQENIPLRLKRISQEVNPMLLQALIAQSYIDIYESFTRQGIFRESPRSIHIRYKTMGIIFEVFGLMLTIASYLFLRTTLSGMILLGISFSGIGMMVYGTAYAIVPYSRLGREVVAQVAAFDLFIKDARPLPWTTVSTEWFYRYAPYAVIFDEMRAWLQRFRQHTRWEVPPWYGDIAGEFMQPEYFFKQMDVVSQHLQELMSVKEED